jgi:hypothetical protein
MFPLTHRFSGFRLAALALTLGLCGPVAHAGFITATAAQNPFFLDSNSSLTAERVSAVYGQASASATRTEVISAADGAGTLAQTAYQSSAGNTAGYTLWDTSSNQAISIDDAALIRLSFNFLVTGYLVVELTDNATAGTQFVVGAGAGGVIPTREAVSAAYGKDSNGTGSLSYIGNAQLLGSYSLNYSFEHANSRTGALTMLVSNAAAVAAEAYSTLTLTSVSFVDGLAVPTGAASFAQSMSFSREALAIRIDETGLLIPVVTAVPEPAAAWLALVGLLGLMGWRRWVPR